MNLWLISQTQNRNWDTYDSAVVVAATEDEARNIHPGGRENNKFGRDDKRFNGRYSDWCYAPEQVSVNLIGEALPNMPSGVVIASYNAG